MRRTGPAFFALSVLAAASGLAQDPGADRAELRRLREQALQAHKSNDHPAFLELSLRLARLLPRSNRALYNLACAYARNGARADAVRVLDSLARRGVAFDLAKDADFAAIEDDPAFAAVVARTAALETPLGSSAVAFTLPDKTLISEGVAHDAKTGAFFVSSVRQRKVVRVAKDGSASDFCASGQHGLFSAVGIAVDPERRALWVSSQASRNMDGFRKQDDRRSLAVELDVDSGRLRRSLTPPAGAVFSDLAVGPKGEVAFADPYTGRVYLLPAGAEQVHALADGGPLESAQGMAFAPDGNSLFVADYVNGIVKIDVVARTAKLLDIPEDVAITGIDGLVWADGSLVGIQNGINPHRVVRLRLDSSMDRIEELSVLERGHPHFDEPTLGVRVGAELFYVANSQYEKIRGDGSLIVEQLKPPVILRARLPWLERR
jgi:sugar lactone lactonase YvrE